MSVRSELQRLRLHYRKDEVLMYIGHLDLMRFIFRCFRRAQFPYAVAGAFSPKPCVTFCPTVPLGVLADAEVLDVELRDGLRIEPAEYPQWLARLAEAAAPRDFIYRFDELSAETPIISRQAVNARYSLRLSEASEAELAAILSGELVATDKLGKTRDLAASLRRWEYAEGELSLTGGCSGDQHLNLTLLAELLRERLGCEVRELRRIGLLDRDGNEL